MDLNHAITIKVVLDDATLAQLSRIEGLLITNAQRMNQMALDLTNLASAVAAIDTAEQSAVTLLNSIAAELLAIAGNQRAVEDFAADLRQRAADLSAAVAAVPTAPAAG